MASHVGPYDPLSNLWHILRVTICPEYFVRWVAIAVRSHEWAHVFPDDVASGSHFEHASPLSLANQGVPAGETLCTTDVRAVECIGRPPTIFPHRLTRSRIKFDDP